MGYHRAGFDVIGVDIAPQPRYPFEFHQGDALDWPLDGFDAIHASPPCQHYANVTRWRGQQDDHDALIAPMRRRLLASGVPWVMENVRTPQIAATFVLCGSMFRLAVRRHRYFETGRWPAFQLVQPCTHRRDDLPFEHKGERAYADAMGCTWMNKTEARQAIPPAYTEWIGHQLAAHLTAALPVSSGPTNPAGNTP
jgi:DNA (cytosine-5)-methyltransferase 1